MALCDILYKRLRNTLTYLLTYLVWQDTCYVKLRRVDLLMKLHFRAMGCHLPCGITQYYLPLNTSEHTQP